MKSMMKVAFAALALTVATAGYSGPAQAGGFIAGAVKTVVKGEKKVKSKANKLKRKLNKGKRHVKQVKNMIKIKKPKR